jgi:transposase
VDATGCAGRAQAAPCGGVPWCAAATMLPGIPGLAVTGVARAEDGCTAVDVVTGPDLQEEARRCPDCGARAVKGKETASTTPRDIRLGDRQLRLRWRKKRWICGNPRCPRGTFTGLRS